MTDPDREYGIRIPDGDVLDPVPDLHWARERLERYRCLHPDAVIVERTITYGPWTPTKEQK